MPSKQLLLRVLLLLTLAFNWVPLTSSAKVRQCTVMPKCSCNEKGQIVVVKCEGTHWELEVPRLQTELPTNSTKRMTLLLGRNNFKTVQRSAFEGLRLGTLDLSHNAIRRFDSEAFGRVESSTDERPSVLKLSSNNLTELPSNLLSALALRLSTLDVSYNSFTSVPFECGKQLPKLRFLHTQKNRIRRLLGACFRGAPRLIFIDLSGNAISRLRLDAFDGIRDALQHLDLSYNAIPSLRPAIFAGMSSLRQLNLVGNKLTSADFLCHIVLPNLRYLLLSNNKIHTFQENCWSSSVEESSGSLPQLHALMLDSNSLENMVAVCGPPLARLQILALANNRIERVPDDCFAAQGSLRNVLLSGNLLTEIGCCLGLEQTQLEHLELARNTIANVSVSLLHQTPHLVTLELGDNQLTSTDFLCSSGEHGGSQRSTKLHIDLAGNPKTAAVGSDCIAALLQGNIVVAGGNSAAISVLELTSSSRPSAMNSP